MRTLIEGGWVVAFNGTSHEVYEQGSVVFEDDRIVHAGGLYAGAADVRLSARGKLVSMNAMTVKKGENEYSVDLTP